MMDNKVVFGSSFSPDKSKVFTTSNRSGVFNICSISISDNTYISESVFNSSSIYSISYSPDNDRILSKMGNNGDKGYRFVKKEIYN